jgi:hypothetical protein
MAQVRRRAEPVISGNIHLRLLDAVAISQGGRRYLGIKGR